MFATDANFWFGTLVPPLDALLAHLRAEPSRTGSLIVTLFGDAVAPHGGEIGLAALLVVFRAMQVSDGVVRTAVSRLTRDGWLRRRRAGRLSFYRLVADRPELAAAEARIYGTLQTPAWRGTLLLAFPEPGTDRGRLEAGFTPVAPGVFTAPDTAPPLPGILTLAASGPALAEFAARAWPLARLSQDYADFVERFAPVRPATALQPLEALVVRTLLIHAYRRIVLRDPLLPAGLLPNPWSGLTARRLCTTLYAELLPQSEAWLASAEAGPLPGPALTRRFSDAGTRLSATASSPWRSGIQPPPRSAPP